MPYLKLGEIQGFTVTEFVKKYWSFYDKTKTGKDAFQKSDEYIQGYSPKYSFKVDGDDMLDLSQNQLGQALVGVFEAKKPLRGSSFLVKTNGQTGKEIRYFINYDYKGVYAQTPSQPTPEPNVATTASQSLNTQAPTDSLQDKIANDPRFIPPPPTEFQEEVKLEDIPF
jgi:hypothetical protein